MKTTTKIENKTLHLVMDIDPLREMPLSYLRKRLSDMKTPSEIKTAMQAEIKRRNNLKK